MKMRKWKALLATFTTALAFSAVGAVFITSLQANAEVKLEYDTITVNGFTVPTQKIGEQPIRLGMDAGAEVRISEDNARQGLRFSSYIYTEDYNAVKELGGTIGTLIMPKDKLGENELTHAIGTAGVDYLDIEGTNVKTDEASKLTRFNGVITALKDTNFDREFCARAYVKIGESYVYSQFDEVEHNRAAKNVSLDVIANDGANDTNSEQLAKYIKDEIANVKKLTLPEYGIIGYLDGYTRKLPIAYKDNYVFEGWYDGTTKVVDTSTNATELEAKWEEYNVLVGFDNSDSTKYIKKVNQSVNTYVPETEWLASFNGANGVVKTATSDKYTPAYGQSKLAVNTGKTADELTKMLSDFDYINIRLYIEGDKATYDLGSQNLTIAKVESKQWVNVQLTKEMIESNSPASHYMNYTTDESKKGINGFVNFHNNNGSGDYLFYVNLKTDESVNGNREDMKGVIVYLDSITAMKYTVAEHAELQKGQSFEIPELSVRGAKEFSYTTSVSYNGEAVSVTNNQFTPTLSGTYVIHYAILNEGVEYAYDYKVELRRTVAEGYLEDFATAESIQNVYVGKENGADKTQTSVDWVDSHTVNNVTKNGVLKVVMNKENQPALWLNLVQTAEELEDLGIFSITVVLTATTTSSDGYISLYANASANDEAANYGNATKYANWTEITIPVTTLKSLARFANADGSMNWSALSCDGEGAWLFRTASAFDQTLYIDGIMYNTTEKAMTTELEDFHHENSTARVVIKNASGTAIAKQPVWYKSKTLGGEEKFGVLEMTVAADNFIYVNFTRTIQELKALNIEYITYDVLTTGSDNLRWSPGDFSSTGEPYKSFGSAANTWKTVKVKVEDLNKYNRFNGDVFNSIGNDATSASWFFRATGTNVVYLANFGYTVKAQ